MEEEILNRISLILEINYFNYKIYLENLREAIQLGLI